MQKVAMLAFVFVMVLEAFPETSYEFDPGDAKIYVATVPKGETNEISEAAATILNGNSVTNFVKRGEGTLVADRDLGDYTGNLIVEEGVYQSCPTAASNTTVGKLDSAGGVFVKDGATLELNTKVWSTTMDQKTVHISGRGFNGRGALVQHESSVTGNGPFGKIVLDADALICNYSSYDFPLASMSSNVKVGSVTVGLHCLSIGGDTKVGFGQGGTLSLDNAGSQLKVEGGGPYSGLYFSSTWGGSWNFWHSSVQLTVAENGTLLLNPLKSTNFAFAIDMFPGASIFANSDTSTYSENSSVNRISFNNGNSGITLRDPDRNAVTFSKSTDFLIVSTKVKGGGLSVGTSSVGGRLALQSWVASGVTKSNNSFTNGIVATKSTVSANASGLIPASGKALVLNDSTVELKEDVTYSLPPLEVHGSGQVVNGTGDWREAVVKDGAGELTYSSLVGAPKLDVQDGSVRFVPQNAALPVFGTVGCAHGGVIDFANISYSVTALTGVPVFANCPSFTVNGNWTIDVDELPKAAQKTTEGTLTFAAESVLTITGDIAAQSWIKMSKSWTIASADGGIVGLPALAAVNDAEHVWTLEKSTDGKKLILRKSGNGLMFVVK